MKKRMYALLFLTCFMLAIPAAAQTKRIDSLKTQVQAAPEGKEKLEALLRLCKEQSSMSPDTVYRYAVLAKTMALAQRDALKASLAEYFIGNQFLTRGLTDSSLVIAGNNLKQLRYTAAEKEVYVDYTLLKARTLNTLTRAKEALDLLYPLLTAAEKKEDTLTQIRTITVMVSALVTTGDDQEAQKWCFKALQLCPQPLPPANRESFGIILNNIGLTFMHLYEGSGKKELIDSAEYYTSKAIEVNTRYQFLSSLAYTLGLKGTLLGISNQPVEGERLLKESLSTYRQTGNTFYIVNAMAVLGNFYGLTKQPQKGIAICKEGIALSTGLPNIYLYLNLAGNYKLAKNYRLYGETMEKLAAIKDSLHQKNSAEALSEIQTRYEMQKKENTIIQQNYALAKKNYLAYGAVGLLLIGSIFFMILIRLNRKKQEYKFQVIQREEKRLNDIAVTKAQEKERTRIAAELHDNLGGQLSYISSNMDFILDAPVQLTEEQKKNHLRKVNETAKTTIADLRESIWALKKQQVDIDDLADKIKLYVQNHLQHQPAMQLEVKEAIAAKSAIPSAEALNIFRIFQEAVNNAVKYSGASLITLCIETSAARLYTISLQDNGKGFDTQAVYNDHYGLENMRNRAKDIHAMLEITSQLPGGSLVKLYKV